MAIRFERDTRLLFVGDSITDCNRREDPDELGQGYVRLVADHLAAADPSRAPKVLNRGISGDKVPDLERRWQRDVLDLNPDVLSVFIGINDVWHGLVPDRQGCSLPDYIAAYQRILTSARAALPKLRLVLCEPSCLRLAVRAGRSRVGRAVRGRRGGAALRRLQRRVCATPGHHLDDGWRPSHEHRAHADRTKLAVGHGGRRDVGDEGAGR